MTQISFNSPEIRCWTIGSSLSPASTAEPSSSVQDFLSNPWPSQIYCPPFKSLFVDLNRNFFIGQLEQSSCYEQICSIADQVETFIAKFDREEFLEAAGICVYAHQGQKRATGEPVAYHPIKVAERAVEILHIKDREILIACLLHDVVEDTPIGLTFIKNRFGTTVANLVDGVTKIEQMGRDKLIDEQNIDKFVNALAKDIRVLLIKMIDRGVNLEDIEAMGKESTERNSREALDFYVPLGILCGFMKAARHLADIAFKKLNPERHARIEAAISEMKTVKQPVLDEFRSEIKRRFRKNVEIMDKPRTPYEVDQIAAMRGKDVLRGSDAVMMQVIVNSEKECYDMLRIIHSLGNPQFRYIRDYIKDPKINGYQSLHTAVEIEGTIVRFQIRTRQMQKISQEGVLADPRSYTRAGNFRQPELTWLNTDWLKMILREKNRRKKIILTKALSQAKPFTVEAEFPESVIIFRKVLFPPKITPREAAFIVDPVLGLRVVGASYRGSPLMLDRPIVSGIDKIQATEDVQNWDHFGMLNNCIARLRLAEFLACQPEEERIAFAFQILEAELAKSFLSLEIFRHFHAAEAKEILLKMASGEISAKSAARRTLGIMKKTKEGSPRLFSLELSGGRAYLGRLIRKLDRVFPIEGFSFKTPRLASVSLVLKSEEQIVQLNHFLKSLKQDAPLTPSP